MNYLWTHLLAVVENLLISEEPSISAFAISELEALIARAKTKIEKP
jgi:hypothetical protein